MKFKEFSYNSLDEIRNKSEELGLNLHFSDNMELFKKKVVLGRHVIPNSLGFHPMEGCDGTRNGSPGELTLRRYERFSRGGAGLLWFEAVSVVHEGRANPRQLWIHEENIRDFEVLVKSYIKNAQEEFGKDFSPLLIAQLTHSGRFSRPDDKYAPIIACKNPIINERYKNEDIAHIIEDHELEALEDKFVEAAVFLKKAGFHGVDVKACHRYLNSELLSAYTRKGKYGETFKGRTRFLLNVVRKIKDRLGSDFIVTTRLNIYDGIEYPYGWGVDRDNCKNPDFTEPLKLVKLLYESGMRIINLTMGTPYYNPHVNRPYDKGGYVPEENPLVGVARLSNGIAKIQNTFPDLAVVGTGYSWLRQFSPFLAAGNIEKKNVTIAGYGRESFAYPDFAKDILFDGALKKEKCCIACGKCTEIMRAGSTPGCVIRDAKVYAPIYKQYCR